MGRYIIENISGDKQLMTREELARIMIKDQWYAVLDSKELKKGRLMGVTRLSEKLVFWRSEDEEVHCIFDRCCHRGASLSAGKLVGHSVECPFHGFQYDSTGKVTFIPANGRSQEVPERFKVNSFLVKEAYGFIWLWHSETKENAPEIPFFRDIREGFAYGGFSEVWPVHYTRAIENQLDVVHLPFVHENTIGRGGNTLVNGPVVEWKGDLMTFYVKNRKDEGQIPEKPAEIKDYKRLFSLQFQMPNMWQNRISDNVRIVAAFVPVDEEHTRIYIRQYRSFAKAPIISQIVNFFSNISNKVILHQDRKVVLTQMPKKSELSMGEKLVQGDLPIVEYRKRRELLKKSQRI